ncbi:MAG: hypothetical protein AAF927_11815 [Bacteroidota bacterium]
MRYLLMISTALCLFGFKGGTPAENASTLFLEDDIIHVRLKADFKAILDDRGEERAYHQATISWNDSLGHQGELPLRVKVRGNFRRSKANCAFPPLRLNFDDGVEGTLFEGQNKLKLVTHCQSGASYQQFILQEYLMYKIYNELTDYSFRVRLLKVIYEDESGRLKPTVRYGFLIEDEDAVAARNGAKSFEGEGVHPNETNKEIEVLLSMYEFMIGNTDWSIPGMHNIKLIRTNPAEPPIAVPYDFDWCGIIATPYAKPNPSLGIESVRIRLYRGFCATDEQWAASIARFNEKKAEIYSLYNDCPDLKGKTRKRAINYLDDFYEIINSEKRMKRELLSQCR